MPTAPSPTEQADRTSHLQDVLTGFVDFGNRLVKLTVEQAEAATLPLEKAAKAYDQVTRSARRSILLIRELAKPATDRVAARKRIIRVVEDTIQREAEAPEAAALHREFLERLDTPDWESELADRPVDDIIADIIHDLGLVAVPGHHPWKRRTPADIAQLAARAAQPLSRPAIHNSA
jgi:hypothetical protein